MILATGLLLTEILFGFWNAIFPVSWFTMAVHHSHDKNVIWFDGVENGIRKYARQIAPYILFKRFPLFRFFGNTLNCVFNRVDKTLPETELASLIISGRILVFFQSLGMKFISHFLMAFLTCARATSPGIVLTRPLRTSSRRRHASLIQSWRISSSSAGSRLSTNLSARRARASLGRERASSAICSTVNLIINSFYITDSRQPETIL